MEALYFLGKFHPVLLHLPIGILIYLYIQYCYDKFYKKDVRDLNFGLVIGVLSTIAASFSGYWLSVSGGYEGELIQWHKYLGFSITGLSILLYIIYLKKMEQLFFSIFTVLIISIFFGGHYGGSITHGEDFLSFNSSKSLSSTFKPETAVAYNDLIAPILEEKCVGCHNESKIKGGLLMTDYTHLLTGGETGPALIPGKLSSSLLYRRIHLDKSEKEHMPPTGKVQLTHEEIKILDWWIESHHSHSDSYLSLAPTAIIQTYVEKLTTPRSDLL